MRQFEGSTFPQHKWMHFLITSGRRPRVIEKCIHECWGKVDPENCLMWKRHSPVKPLMNWQFFKTWSNHLTNKEKNLILYSNMEEFSISITYCNIELELWFFLSKWHQKFELRLTNSFSWKKNLKIMTLKSKHH